MHALSSSAVALIAAATLAFSATAKDTSKSVQFKKGESSASMSGSFKGYDTVTYKLTAAAGQSFHVEMNANNGACYFSVIAPGADSAMHMGDVNGNSFTGTLNASGEYRTQVFMMRSAARRKETCKYAITFTIHGAAASSPAPVEKGMPSAAEQACMQAVSMQTQNPDVVLISSEFSQAATEVIVGVGPNKARWRCLVASDGTVTEVMSLTDEGRM
jgi:hypothetical protein